MGETEPSLPDLSEREILESMGPDGIVDHILELGARATHLETKMNMASVVLEGAYGVTVEDVLQRRQTSGLHLHDAGDTSGENR